jgi:hypothetical protein
MVRHRLQRATALVLLLGWLAGFVAPVDAATHADRDTACGEPGWTTSDRARAGISSEPTVAPDEHCGLCHLQRAMRDVVGAPGRSPAALPIGRALAPNPSSIVPTHSIAARASRGPPVFLT